MDRAHPLRTLTCTILLALLSWCSSPQIATAAPWSFAVLGDQQNPDPSGVNTQIVEKMAAQIATQNPAFVLCNGDQILGIGNLTNQYTNWKNAMGPILSISYPVRGNHEALMGDINTPGPNYAKYWMDNIANALPQIPKNGPPNEVGMSYSFSNQNVFIVALEQSYATSSYQVNQSWLNDQLKANTLPFTFVYGHYPAFGLNVPDTEFLSKYPAQRDAFWQSLGDSSVNIYFTAHVHLYDRAMISINGGPQFQQIVVGAGGAPLETWDGTYQTPGLWEKVVNRAIMAIAW